MKLLSICGGGVWGAGVASFLRSMSANIAEPRDYFDAFAGTSTGAIIAACYAAGKSSAEIDTLFKAHAAQIFTKEPWWKRKIPFSSTPTYTNREFIKILKAVFGDLRMCDLDKICYIVAWRTNGNSRNKVFDNRDTIPVWQAVLASAAAPTYFPSVTIDGMEYLDGGLWANNPALCAVSAISEMCKPEDVKCLTIVTGGQHRGKKTGNLSLIKAGLYIGQNLLVGRATGTDYMLQKFSPNSMIVCPSLSTNQDYGLDAVSDIPDIRNLWNGQFSKVKPKLISFLRAQ
jgi:patatin-like phospholipase/acyl hydrolase